MDSHMRQYLWETIEEAISLLQGENEDYSKLIKDREKQSAEVVEILSRLNKTEQEVFEQYQNTNNLAWGVEKTHIYIKGFRDCYRLLKWLNS